MPQPRQDYQWTVLFCDTVRQEVTGKLTIVGMVQSDLIAERGPHSAAMSVFIGAAPAFAGGQRLEASVRLGDKLLSQIVSTTVEPTHERTSTIIFEGLPVEFSDRCELTVHVKLGDEDFGQIGALSIWPRDEYNAHRAALAATKS